MYGLVYCGVKEVACLSVAKPTFWLKCISMLLKKNLQFGIKNLRKELVYMDIDMCN